MIQPNKQSVLELIDQLPDSEIIVLQRFLEFLIDQAQDQSLDESDNREAKELLLKSSEGDWISWSMVEKELDALSD